MPVVSIRFSAEPVHRRLQEAARQKGVGMSTLAERFIDEGLRSEAHPLVVFRSGPSGRRPVLIGGPEVADVVSAIVGGDVPPVDRRARAAALLDISEAMVDASLAYYAEFTDEIDAMIADRLRHADEAEESWQRQRALLER